MRCWSLWDKMERKIFSSKILYLLNLIFNSGFLVLTLLSLLALVFIDDDNKLVQESKFEQLALYSAYVIVYTIAIAVLFLKPKRAIFYLNLTYLVTLTINFYEFLKYYSKSNHNSTKQIYVIMILIFIIIFMSFIYFNNKYKFKMKFSEIEEIGTQ